MFNSDTPNRAELPTSRQLLRSTLIALVTAIVLLVTVVLPAEYGIDPTGVGRVLQLTEMGNIKQQLASEAEADRVKDQKGKTAPTPPEASNRSGLLSVLASLFISPAAAETPPAAALAERSDEMTITLKPDQGGEIKMQMKKGAKAKFTWVITGGTVNFDEHGDGPGDNAISYEKGRSVANKEGVLEAAFDGIHGWFWRNRGTADVIVTLRTSGEYSEIKQME